MTKQLHDLLGKSRYLTQEMSQSMLTIGKLKKEIKNGRRGKDKPSARLVGAENTAKTKHGLH